MELVKKNEDSYNINSYNIYYQCNYKNYENDYKELINKEEFNSNLKEEDKYLLEKKIYQDDFLSIFGIEEDNEFRDHIISYMVNELYIKLKKNKDMRNLMKKICSENKLMGLMMMFSIELLYLAHPCFCEFLEKGMISEDKYNLLKNEIEKNIELSL